VDALPYQQEINFAPQSHFVLNKNSSKLLVDEIICTEDLKAGWKRLQEMELNLAKFGDLPTQRLRASSKTSTFNVKDVDSDTERRLKDFYHNDFRLWEEHCHNRQ